jgi:hypothetical protein
MSTVATGDKKGRVLLAYSGGLGECPTYSLSELSVDRTKEVPWYRHLLYSRMAHRAGLRGLRFHGRCWPGGGL